MIFLIILANLIAMLKLYYLKPLWLVLFILWTALLATVALIPDSSMVVIDTGSEFRWDYLEHFIAYLVFGSLYILWRSDTEFTLAGHEIAILFSGSIVFSILTEYAQVLIPGREFNFIDMVYNMLGVFAGILFTYLLLIRLILRALYRK